jgi:hypothetical protein
MFPRAPHDLDSCPNPNALINYNKYNRHIKCSRYSLLKHPNSIYNNPSHKTLSSCNKLTRCSSYL